MNIQKQISKLQTKLTHIETLLDKEIWTTEETSSYGNKKTLSVEKGFVEASIQLCVIEFYLDKPSKDWTDDEKDKYGSKEQLRKEKEQLRKEKVQLLEQQTILLRIKEKTNAEGIQGSKSLTVDVEMEVDITPEEATKSLIQLISLDNGNKNIFSAQDSMETLNLDESILNLNVKSLDGVPNLLYSEEIYNTEKEIGIEMPIDRLVKIIR
ncbi:hypothetical protein HDV01_003120 [Terramyces sp. JEL0728]|nr:hypothetical protein HDV01_003120 [Terramyces sp. JEL0728]